MPGGVPVPDEGRCLICGRDRGGAVRRVDAGRDGAPRQRRDGPTDGAAVFSASVIDDATGVNMGIGFLGVALAFA